jgi:hypothetical protein
MERIFFDYGIEICKENDKFYLIFDDGGIVAHYANIEISKEHAEYAMKGSKEAGEIIIHYQQIEDNKRKKSKL